MRLWITAAALTSRRHAPCTFAVNEVYNIDVLVSTGAGKVGLAEMCAPRQRRTVQGG